MLTSRCVSVSRLTALVSILCCFSSFDMAFANANAAGKPVVQFPPDVREYGDEGKPLLERLRGRIEQHPFNLVGTLIFGLAIIHTFLCARFRVSANRLQRWHYALQRRGRVSRNSVAHLARLMQFFGEVEVVFGLWAVALFWSIAFFFDWSTAKNYVNHHVDYTEAMFIVVIMTLASTRPVLQLSEATMNRVAGLFGASLTAWWFSILTIGPILGSFITEPAAMTISAMLLNKKFYALNPRTSLKYATLALLFVNVSVGGTLTNFAAPPVMMVSEAWGWSSAFMFGNFGWKAILGIIITNVIYWFFFRRGLRELEDAYAIRQLQEETQTRYFSREQMEAELDAIANESSDLGDLNKKLKAIIEDYSDAVEEKLKKRYLDNISEMDVDLELADKAFTERFEEVKLAQLQERVPAILPEEKQPPFLDPNWDKRADKVPRWVMVVHVLFMVWTIVNSHSPAMFGPGLMFFIGFEVVTADYQNRLNLQMPLLVGLFLGGLVTLGGVQAWWIGPVLEGLDGTQLMSVSVALTAVNDNAAITYLATLVPEFADDLKYAVVSGAVIGGGLTLIANAPNPAGQAILKSRFKHGVSHLGLLAFAILPTLIMFAIFSLLH